MSAIEILSTGIGFASNQISYLSKKTEIVASVHRCILAISWTPGSHDLRA